MRHAKLDDLQRALGLFLPLTISLPFALHRLSQVSGEAVSTLCLMLNAKERKKDLINLAWPEAQHLSIHFTSFIAYSYSGSWGLQPFTIQRTHTQSHTHTRRLFEPVFMTLHLRRKLEEKPQRDSIGRCKRDTERWNWKTLTQPRFLIWLSCDV